MNIIERIIASDLYAPETKLIQLGNIILLSACYNEIVVSSAKVAFRRLHRELCEDGVCWRPVPSDTHDLLRILGITDD